jgi:hypothetical protein
MVSVAVAMFLAIVSLGISGKATAQDKTQVHPVVGTWIADSDPENTENAKDVYVFNADGSYIEADSNGDVGLGSWEATGANTANLTIKSEGTDADGHNLGSVIIRAAIEVAADGNTFTAEYTIQFIEPNGTSSGELGPGKAIGERLVVEAPGKPVKTLEEYFGASAGTPEASPVP